MTGPTFTPDWSEHEDNDAFEKAIYSDRLNIDDWKRRDLVTRSGLPVTIERVEGCSAYGTVAGRETSWYKSGNSFVEFADCPGAEDVMLPVVRGAG